MVRAVANPPQAVGGAGKAAEVSPVERFSQPPPVAHTFTNSKREVLKTANREAVSSYNYERNETNPIRGPLYADSSGSCRVFRYR